MVTDSEHQWPLLPPCSNIRCGLVSSGPGESPVSGHSRLVRAPELVTDHRTRGDNPSSGITSGGQAQLRGNKSSLKGKQNVFHYYVFQKAQKLLLYLITK